ncbi:uncharacterized protein LOC118421664 [Branchiostoma floridae]|uniref:Uncharacterized protein LOC118421664 n=1 Tax=Branchiostoma floridae TaxID=7739 RepID=A0A9J7LLB3_BRAFL|nr:uncharacterized protein LOC118421664 [Branchiostoma floridae]
MLGDPKMAATSADGAADAEGSPSSQPPPPYPGPPGLGDHFKLKHIDFMPVCLDEGGFLSHPKYDRFDGCIELANQWLIENPQVEVKSCESLEVRAKGSKVNTDLATYYEYGKARSFFVRGLRVWYGPRLDLPAGTLPQQIGYLNVVPGSTNTGGVFQFPDFEPFGQTINRLNGLLKETPIPGRILNLETRDMKYHGTWTHQGVDPDRSCWTQSGETTTMYLFVIRVFYLLGPPVPEEIGVADFVPEMISPPQGIFSNPQFENFPSVMTKARSWAEGHLRTVRLINIQSFDVKVHRSKFTGAVTIDSQRASHIEHGKHTTAFIRIIRLVYGRLRGSLDLPPPLPMVLSVKTFVPAIICRGGSWGIPQYESLRDTIKRAQVWLSLTGVNVVSAETISIRMHYGRISDEGADTTLTYHRTDHGSYFLTAFRIYIDGVYEEPSPDLLPPPPDESEFSMDDFGCCNVM